ncbi:hypothetical protein [Enterococcus durans]|uniref:hypothetical protein n=1 Tax=Enterococcus durans TaxID=53345 RepID=UPI001C035838|nr:hypothetical protein [Enterococcus durans]
MKRFAPIYQNSNRTNQIWQHKNQIYDTCSMYVRPYPLFSDRIYCQPARRLFCC